MFSENFFNMVTNIKYKYPEIFNNLRLYYEHKKLKKIEHKTRINLTIDPIIYHKFKEYCSLNGMKVSSKIEQLMKERLKS